MLLSSIIFGTRLGIRTLISQYVKLLLPHHATRAEFGTSEENRTHIVRLSAECSTVELQKCKLDDFYQKDYKCPSPTNSEDIVRW